MHIAHMMRASSIVGCCVVACLVVSGGLGPVRSSSASISSPRYVTNLHHAKRHGASRTDTCSSYSGSRLYADNLEAIGSQLIQAFEASARGTATPICSMTVPSFSPQIGGMTVTW